MAKKTKQKSKIPVENRAEVNTEFPEIVENRFKNILHVMSWIVGVSFILIIILPNFDFFLVDEIVKFTYFLGIFNLIMFAVLEMLSGPVKNLLSKIPS
ncbi:MAG: hypothetical protein E4H13_08400 [Calditrichales bacterium]|nr:MAG: hypothetical protein E4H13_08400 [Calditrichales bacterium]